ncbi:peptide methionine sulfoxide reductase-like isoform X2 [Condylostylus longicornis]|uniref:peptide methionine sulfoxide reductase-like isoform X2 n=1 Tax=Condylostylus longicornis TaxID=2530218 RepID=UPI00244E30AC|nr:peptide methionine sulfoxide reductase-like isoform X2 [Condylostylus longicornis]
MLNRYKLFSFIEKFFQMDTKLNQKYSLRNPPSIKDQTIVQNEQKELNITPAHHVDIPYERATFGMGCFWGAESLYGATAGVLRTTVGYSGGTTENPTYRNIGDHTEVLVIDYDPTKVNYNKLLHLFWNNHEYGLCTKIKKQYASIIFYHDDAQKKIAEESRIKEQKLRVKEVIRTEIVPAGTFYPAENYHQKYRLQGHKDLMKSLGMHSESTELLQRSYVATKLNGYVVGLGGEKQFLSEVDTMNLTPSQIEYIRYYIEKNEGQGLYC